MMWATRISISMAASAAIFSAAQAHADPNDAPAADPANEKSGCEQAFEQAQRDQNDAHFLSAIKQALACSNPKCGDAIVQECAKMYSALELATPSVVLAARDASKATDLNDVVITIDGEQVTDQLDGRPIPIDPGPHTFRFSAPKYVPDERKVLIHTGEKYRQISVALTPVQSAEAPPAPLAPPISAPPPAPAPSERKIPVASWVFGGVGIAALGAGAVFRLIANSDYDSMSSSCKPHCFSSDVSSLKLKYQLSDVAFGVGAAALIGAVVVYATSPKQSAPAVALLFTPTPGGFSARLMRPF